MDTSIVRWDYKSTYNGRGSCVPVSKLSIQPVYHARSTKSSSKVTTRPFPLSMYNNRAHIYIYIYIYIYIHIYIYNIHTIVASASKRQGGGSKKQGVGSKNRGPIFPGSAAGAAALKYIYHIFSMSILWQSPRSLLRCSSPMCLLVPTESPVSARLHATEPKKNTEKHHMYKNLRGSAPMPTCIQFLLTLKN